MFLCMRGCVGVGGFGRVSCSDVQRRDSWILPAACLRRWQIFASFLLQIVQESKDVWSVSHCCATPAGTSRGIGFLHEGTAFRPGQDMQGHCPKALIASRENSSVPSRFILEPPPVLLPGVSASSEGPSRAFEKITPTCIIKEGTEAAIKHFPSDARALAVVAKSPGLTR